jgi:hypothetical protein
MDHNHHKPKSSVEFVALPFEFIESLAAKAPLPSLSHGIAYSVALLDAPWGSGGAACLDNQGSNGGLSSCLSLLWFRVSNITVKG